MPTSVLDESAAHTTDTGLEVLDLHSDVTFVQRPQRPRNAAEQTEALSRLARAFIVAPDTLLQELVDAAIELCGAGSAGISIQRTAPDGAITYHWVATAGAYKPFLDAVLPASPSACGVCLERDRPQVFRVGQRFFDLMHVEAATVTDGILLPWHSEDTNGTIWILAHASPEAFDLGDYRLMKVLADFTALAVRQQRQRALLLQQAEAAAAAGMANQLAHQINNPLQGLTNLVYLAAEHGATETAQELARQMSPDLQRLCTLVQKLLALPVDANRR